MWQKLSIFILILTLTGCGAVIRRGGDGRYYVKLTDKELVIKDHIRFAHDSDEILEESHGLLDEIAAVLIEHRDVRAVDIHGHTSALGDKNHNKDLSERRAAAVAAYLREKNVPQTIESHGFGEDQLLCETMTDSCHEQNRRVEFFVVYEYK